MENTYSIRLTYDMLINTDYNICCQLIMKDVKRYYLVNETSGGGVKHLQGWIDLGDMKIATFRKHIREFIKKNIPEDEKTGNKYFSIKQCDEELPPSLLSYFMKEDQNPITNLKSSDLQESVERQEQYKRDMKEKKENKKKVFEKIIEKYDMKNEEYFTNTTDFIGMYDKIFTDVLDYHTDNGILIRDNSIHNYVITIGCLISRIFKHDYVRHQVRKYRDNYIMSMR